MAWTTFFDMHSGGGRKTKYAHIFIEAPENEAVAVFEAKFDRDPYNITCSCCGGDYSIDDEDDLERATEYVRRTRWGEPVSQTVDELIASGVGANGEPVLILFAKDFPNVR